MNIEISSYWQRLQQTLFPEFEASVAPTTEKHREIAFIFDVALRKLYGWIFKSELAFESTFSNAFKEFSHSNTFGQAHDDLIKRYLKDTLVFHINRDSTAIEAREKRQKKRQRKRKKLYWNGYKLHLDVADSGIPTSAILTSASVHDSQVAIPLEEMTSKKVTSLYTLQDAAYASLKLEPQKERYKNPTTVERTYSDIKLSRF